MVEKCHFVPWQSFSFVQRLLKLIFRHNINWDELNVRLLNSKQSEIISNSIRKMNSQNFSPSSLDCEILDQFIGPNGEEPQILLSVGSKTLVTTDGYPPWVSSFLYTQMPLRNTSSYLTVEILHRDPQKST